MAQKAESQNESSGKIANFANRYSNASTASGYRSAMFSFIRCINKLPKTDASGKKADYDYETLFDAYLSDKTRDHNKDFVTFANCLKSESTSILSARQIMTYVRCVLDEYGVKVRKSINRDLKREMKGGAATINKVMTAKVIDAALKEMDVKGRALVLTLISSGMRLNEALSLRIQDVDFNASPVQITIRKSKNKQKRFTFISKEAEQCVKVWMSQREAYLKGSAGRIAGLVNAGICEEKDTNTDVLFPFHDSAANRIWESALKASGQFSEDSETGRNQLRIHSFRAFFISQLSMAGQKTLAEKLAGHAGYLNGSYLQIDVEQAGKEYLKVMHVLTIAIPTEYREKVNEITGTIRTQTESIEGLRSQNEKLQRQMEKMNVQHNEEIANLKSALDEITQTLMRIVPK